MPIGATAASVYDEVLGPGLRAGPVCRRVVSDLVARSRRQDEAGAVLQFRDEVALDPQG